MLFRGIVVGAASGKLGAMVASHNKGGQYMRARVVPSGAVPTPQQSAIRNAVASLSVAWSTDLTADQRSAWEVYALNVPGRNALGDAIQLSGQNWYIGANVVRLQNDLARVDDAPTTFDRGTPSVTPSIVAMNNSGAYTLSLGSTITGGAVAVYNGAPFNLGRSKYYGGFQLSTLQDLTAGAMLITGTASRPLDVTTNQMAFQLVFLQDDGRYSAPLRVTFPSA